MDELAYVVAYCDAELTDAEAWKTGDFEPYDYYADKSEAYTVTDKLRQELRSQNRKDVKIFVKAAPRKWCEENLQ